MTIDKCVNMLMAKEKCMERETSGTDTDCNFHNCDDCSLCYEQGTTGEQKEALRFAVDIIRKYQKIESLINSWELGLVDNIGHEISEVIEDGNDN